MRPTTFSARELSRPTSFQEALFKLRTAKNPFVRFKNLAGFVEQEEYTEVAQATDACARQYLEMRRFSELVKQAKPYILPSDDDRPKKPPTGATAYWNARKLSKKIVSHIESATCDPFSYDKEVLIKIFGCFLKKKDFSIKSDVILINEGCDTGDYLKLIIPFLKKEGAKNVKIFLVNGCLDKLNLAGRIGKTLLSEDAVTIAKLNSFEEIPLGLEAYDKFQKIFLPFRLVVVEKPSKIVSFLKTRLSLMKTDDVGICSFLHNDSLAAKTLKSRGYKLDVSSLYYSTFSYTYPDQVTDKFKKAGTKKEDMKIFNTSFSPAKIKTIFKEIGGEIVHMSLIPAHTDGEDPINTVGVIFRKK